MLVCVLGCRLHVELYGGYWWWKLCQQRPVFPRVLLCSARLKLHEFSASGLQQRLSTPASTENESASADRCDYCEVAATAAPRSFTDGIVLPSCLQQLQLVQRCPGVCLWRERPRPILRHWADCAELSVHQCRILVGVLLVSRR